MDQGSADAIGDIPVSRQAQEVIGIAPGAAITLRRTMLPGKRRATALAAMPYALEESLTEDVDVLHFTLLDWQPGEPATVAIVARDRLAGWIAVCNEANIALDQVLPDYLLLPRHADNVVTVSPAAVGDSSVICVRSANLEGFSLDRAYLDYWLDSEVTANQSIAVSDREMARQLGERDNLRVSFWDIGQSPGQWLRAGGAQALPAGFSLLHGEFIPAHRARSYRPLRIAAMCAAVAVGVYYGSMLIENRQLAAEQRALTTEMRRVLANSFPDQPWLGRPRNQVESLLAGAGTDSDDHQFQRLLGAVTRITRQHQAEIAEVNFRDRSLTVLCNVSGLSVLDDIRNGLQALPGMSAELLSSGATDSQVTGRFRVRAG